MEHDHIIVADDAVRDVKFKAKSGRGKQLPEKRNREDQAELLRIGYHAALEESRSSRSGLSVDGRYKASGSYIEVEVNRKSINIDSMDTLTGAKLMNIKEGMEDNPEIISATLFLTDDKAKWLDKRLNEYSNPGRDSLKTGAPANSKLIDSIEGISSTDVSSLFTVREDRCKYEEFPSDLPMTCEIWINIENGGFDESDLFGRLDALKIEHGEKSLVFANAAVVLVKCLKKDLDNIKLSINNIAEFRLFREASILLSANITVQDEWMELIQSSTEICEPSARVGIIDSGVNNKHPLLYPFLPDLRCHSVINAEKHDAAGHGTMMAGIVLYGDLTDVIHAPGNIRINTDLTSVKIFPGRDEPQNDRELYGVIMEDAVSTARNDGADIQCCAVTASEGNTSGEPSSWSAAIDEILYGGGEADTVLFISAGNVKQTGDESYPDFNIHSEVKDPAQSWNAVTVGAYTEKCLVRDPNYAGIQPVASKGGLSPFSTTSMMWESGLIKPEIMMEGGNAVDRYGELVPPDDLCLVSTGANWRVKKFEAIYATSAATAMAAGLAAKIKCRNPNLSALSIRALMIHSAEWTEEMKNKNRDDNGKINIHALLHTCGYGVPNEEKAVASSDSYVTFIAEQTLTPLVRGGDGKYKLKAMHLFNLPWPREILERMGAEEVKLKITLSYYIQPAPGSKTRENKYRYPSLRLRFDVNKPTETEDQFISRVANIEIEGTGKSKNDTDRWNIGIQKRNNGSVISDFIVASAADIASCNMIAVFPASGWWGNRKYIGEKSVRYSLVVSLETPETEIYNSVSQKNVVEIF